MNIFEKYWEYTYRSLILYIPLACMCAGIFYTLCWMNGMYPDISLFWIAVFDISHWIYFTSSLRFIYRKKYKREAILDMLPEIKKIISLELAIQFNFIIHLFASDYVWTCVFIFFVVIAFLADFKLMVGNSIFYIISLFIGHDMHSEIYLPSNTPHYVSILAFRIVVVCVVAVFLWILTFRLEKFLTHTKMEDEEKQFLLEKQLEYYERLDLMDKEIRRFRHDIKNHFACIEHLLIQEQSSEAIAYFTHLKEEYDGTKTLYMSGNVIIDSILNYNLSIMKERMEVDILVFGHLPQIETVTSMDLCTVFSNILSNAIWALKHQTGNEKKLMIRFQSGKQYFSITVSNSTDETEVRENHTEHANMDRNHGHGKHQIHAVIEKYQGTFEQKIEEGLFVSHLCLPI